MTELDSVRQSQTMRMLERGLDLILQRHQVLLANVANEETPGYRAKDLDFRGVLAAAGGPAEPLSIAHVNAAPHPRHLALPGDGGWLPAPAVIDLPASSAGLDGNTVAIEKTMALLYENSMLYQAASQILSKKYQGLLTAIREAGAR